MADVIIEAPKHGSRTVTEVITEVAAETVGKFCNVARRVTVHIPTSAIDIESALS